PPRILLLPDFVFAKPHVVHGNVHGHPPRIVAKGRRRPLGGVGLAAKLGVVVVEAGGRGARPVQIRPRRIGAGPVKLLVPVLGVGGPHLQKRRQVVRRGASLAFQSACTKARFGSWCMSEAAPLVATSPGECRSFLTSPAGKMNSGREPSTLNWSSNVFRPLPRKKP
nr:hypothetical protein [Tanacetum cinerariifolium]